MSAERHPFATSSGNAALFYVSFTPAAQVIFALPGFTFTLPSIGSNPTLGLAFLDPTAASVLWQYALYGSPAISGTSVTFNSVGGQIQFQAGKTYWFALYAGLAVASPSPAPSATPAPTASPSPSPTPSPSPSATASATPTASPNPITVNPTSVTVAHGGGTATVIITEASANFISVASQDTTKATVSPSSGASPLTITITGVAVGTTKIVITDNNLVQQTVSVTVT